MQGIAVHGAFHQVFLVSPAVLGTTDNKKKRDKICIFIIFLFVDIKTILKEHLQGVILFSFHKIFYESVHKECKNRPLKLCPCLESNFI